MHVFGLVYIISVKTILGFFFLNRKECTFVLAHVWLTRLLFCICNTFCFLNYDGCCIRFILYWVNLDGLF
jgi:hypothetical protein